MQLTTVSEAGFIQATSISSATSRDPSIDLDAILIDVEAVRWGRILAADWLGVIPVVTPKL
jgi:hypothetical protein